MTSHGLNVSTERLETLFWAPRLVSVSSRYRHSKVSVSSRSRQHTSHLQSLWISRQPCYATQWVKWSELSVFTIWRRCSISATWGSRFTTGLFFILLARSAYLRVPRVSAMLESAGLMHAIISVWLLPPSESTNITHPTLVMGQF